MKTALIAIDPGKRIGWALALGGRLMAYGTVGDPRELPAATCAIVEMPRVYPSAAKWKGDPQDIVKVAFIAGRCAERYLQHWLVEPREWRGGAPEHVIRTRTEGARRPDDCELGGSVHAWDAIGLLFYFLGRFRR